jgi:RNA polymerase sigma factor (sigma-70 family)
MAEEGMPMGRGEAGRASASILVEPPVQAFGNPDLAWPADPVEILRILYPILLGAAVRLDPARPQDARPLVQDAVVEILVRHPDFEGIDHPLGYARTVLYRLAYAGRRRAAREVPLDVLTEMDRMVQGDHQEEVAARVAMHGALEPLGRRQRACLQLRYVEGLGTPEIAAVLGCSESTVRSQIARGLRRIRGALDEPAPDPDTDPPTPRSA